VQLRFDAGQSRGTTGVGDPSRASLVPPPAPPDWKVGEFALKALDHDASVGGPTLLTDDQFAMRRARSSKDIDASREQRRVVTYDDEDSIASGANRVGCCPRRSKTCVRPWVSEIDDDSVTWEFTECGSNRTKTVSDLQAIGAPESRDDTQPGPIWYGYGLSLQHSGRHRPVAETIRKTPAIKSEIEQVRDRAPFHVAIDKDY
jgi:hypothetical protein